MKEQFFFNSGLIKCFGSSTNLIQDTELEEIVYHYTSPEAFLSIVSKSQLRFTDIRYLNDKSEGLFFVKKLIEFTEKRSNLYPFFSEVVMTLLQENDFEALKQLSCSEIKYSEEMKNHSSNRTFVFCASTEADSLHMWNYYVRNGNYQGYNLGLKVYNLLKTFDTPTNFAFDPFIVYYGKVLYSEQQQFAEIKRFAEYIEEVQRYRISLQEAEIELKSYIGLQGMFFKSPKFKDEQEYRILLSFDKIRAPGLNAKSFYFGENNQKIKEDFRTGNGLIIPFLIVELPKDAISRVYLSPITEFEIAKSSTKELLNAYKYQYQNQSVKVFQSKIPIRF